MVPAASFVNNPIQRQTHQLDDEHLDAIAFLSTIRRNIQTHVGCCEKLNFFSLSFVTQYAGFEDSNEKWRHPLVSEESSAQGHAKLAFERLKIADFDEFLYKYDDYSTESKAEIIEFLERVSKDRYLINMLKQIGDLDPRKADKAFFKSIIDYLQVEEVTDMLLEASIMQLKLIEIKIASLIPKVSKPPKIIALKAISRLILEEVHDVYLKSIAVIVLRLFTISEKYMLEYKKSLGFKFDFDRFVLDFDHFNKGITPLVDKFQSELLNGLAKEDTNELGEFTSDLHKSKLSLIQSKICEFECDRQLILTVVDYPKLHLLKTQFRLPFWLFEEKAELLRGMIRKGADSTVACRALGSLNFRPITLEPAINQVGSSIYAAAPWEPAQEDLSWYLSRMSAERWMLKIVKKTIRLEQLFKPRSFKAYNLIETEIRDRERDLERIIARGLGDSKKKLLEQLARFRSFNKSITRLMTYAAEKVKYALSRSKDFAFRDFNSVFPQHILAKVMKDCKDEIKVSRVVWDTLHRLFERMQIGFSVFFIDEVDSSSLPDIPKGRIIVVIAPGKIKVFELAEFAELVEDVQLFRDDGIEELTENIKNMFKNINSLG